MSEKVFLCNTIERREYYLPSAHHVVRIIYGYPHVWCRVIGTVTATVHEEYKADKRHPRWQNHVQVFETLAWHKYKLLAELERNRQKSGSFR